MVLYTIVPPEQIFLPGADGPDTAPTELVCRGGAWYEGTRCQGGYRIRRILSTDPADYLDARRAPGQLLEDLQP